MTDTFSYLFGFAEEDPSADFPAGPLGDPVGVALDGVAGFAIVSTIDTAWTDDDLTDISWVAPRAVHHDAVLRAAQLANVVPLRFGSLFTDRSLLLAECRALATDLPTMFDDLRDRAEFRVTATPPSRGDDEPTSGAEYLRRRQRAAADHDRVANEVATLAGRLVTDASLVQARPGEIVIDVLATSDELDRLTDQLLAREYGVGVEGPLPPYHFVRLGDGSEGGP